MTKYRTLFFNVLQKVNAAELLRLYLDYDRLEEAALMSVEYIEALLGKGKEYYGLEVWSNVLEMFDYNALFIVNL